MKLFESGLWELVPIELNPSKLVESISFQKVFVSDNKMTFSGGPNARTQVQEISIHKTPSGTLYVDKSGTICTEFDPQNGILKFDNALGYKVMWKREGQLPMVNQPSSLPPL